MPLSGCGSKCCFILFKANPTSMRIDHIAIWADDIELLRAFYTRSGVESTKGIPVHFADKQHLTNIVISTMTSLSNSTKRL